MASIINIEKSETGFVADYFQGTGTENYGVLVLGGSEGGKPNHLASKIVKLGYSVLSLAYFKHGNELPKELEEIPLEYFYKAKKWFLKRKEIKNDGLILIGWSKGAELALILSSQDKDYKGVIAISPSSTVWPGIMTNWSKKPSSSWTFNNIQLPFIPYSYPNNYRQVADIYKRSLEKITTDHDAIINVEKIVAPILLLSGSLDAIWPSDIMSELILNRIKEYSSNKNELCTHFNYPKAGHLLDEKFNLGGTKEDNLIANKDSFLKMKAFLNKCNTSIECV